MWFNPWVHQSSEEVWSGLAWSIIDATRNILSPRADRQRYWLSRNASRLDCAAVRRVILQRIWRPTLAAAVALAAPLVIALISGRASLLTQAPRSPDGWALLAVAAVFVGLAAWAAWQYLFGRITRFLPADLLDGPVLARRTTSVAGERLPRELQYLTTTGALYRAKEDVHNLVAEFASRGYQTVVFVDDLDRCTDSRVAGVFEAIYSFMSDQDNPDAAPRFVIGLDPSVVAARLRAACSLTDGTFCVDPDDPDPGWSLLRKLCQLTVVLPGIRSAHTVRLLRRHIPARTAHTPPSSPPDRAAAAPGEHGVSSGLAADSPPAPPSSTVPAASAVPPSGADTRLLVALEGDPTVQEHLRQLVMLRPRQTMRETKRLLTLWGFYVGLLRRLLPVGVTANALGACQVLTLAEIIRRWPALVPALARASDGPSGLSILIEAIRTDGADQSAAWSRALASLGLSGPEYATATANLRELLLRHGTKTVADFSDSLL